jgi:pilus assembly protein CpaB
MSRITKIIAVILILLATLLAALAWRLGHQANQATPEIVDSKSSEKIFSYEMVVAVVKLEAGKPILAKDVKIIKFPQKIPDALTSPGAAVGKIPLTEIAAEALVMESNLASGLALKLAIGERAVAVPIDEVIGVGNKVEAGDYVDVFFTLKNGNDIDKSQSRLLASKRHVLAYGATVIGEAQNTSSNTQQSTQARTAVLAVPVEEINTLLLAAQNGKLTLALRHPGDSGLANATLFNQPGNVLNGRSNLSQADQQILKSADNLAFSGVELSSWANNSKSNNKSTPQTNIPKVKSPANTIEVIKGTQRENVNF